MKRLMKDGTLTAEGYYKDMSYLLITNNKVDFLELQNTMFEKTSGKNWGLDISYSLNRNRLSLCISYSLGFSWFVHNGRHIPGNWDRRHSLTLFGGFNFGKGWQLSIKHDYKTGLPYTPKVGYYRNWCMNHRTGRLEQRDHKSISGNLNSMRTPSYARLDVNIKKKISENFNVEFQFLNIYNYKNIMNYYYDYTFLPPKRCEHLMLPFLFAINLGIAF